MQASSSIPPRRNLPGLLWAAAAFGASLALHAGLGRLSGLVPGAAVPPLHLVVAAAVWLSGAWLVIRLVDALFWTRIVAPRLGGSVPRLLKDVGAVLIVLLSIGGYIGLTLGYSVTGFWATSGVVGIVVGLALQSMIADVFSGIAINVDRPFVIGDWIRLQPRGSTEPLVGRVVEISWRATRLVTRDNVTHVVPNNLLGTLALTNLTMPSTRSRFELEIRIDFSVGTQRVLRVLEAAVRSVDGVLAEPEPRVRIEEVDESGVEYSIQYWLDTAMVSPHKGRHRVSESVLRHLGTAGISLAHPKQDLHVGPLRRIELDADLDRVELLRRNALFARLEGMELEALARAMKRRELSRGDLVIEQGKPGDSMFVVVEGLLSVVVANETTSDGRLQVGRMTAGDFFGEMSLLTGEPRSASVEAATDSVAFEIRREDIQELIAARPELVRHVSRVIAERQAEGADARSRAQAAAEETETATRAERIYQRINRFFAGSSRRSA